jgi:AcrR family transcriptional regulator
MAGRETRARVRTATREGLLEAAERVFAEKGVDGARIEDIAARADVAVGTIYNYFGDSAELLQALISQRRTDLLARIDAAMADAKHRRAPWSGQVEAFIQTTLECMRDHHPFYAILMQCENRKAPPSLGSVSAEFYERAAALIERGVRLGLVREADASILPAMLVTMCRAPLLHLRLKPGAAWTDDLSDQMLRFFCALVRSEPEPERDRQRRTLGRPVWKALIKASKPRRQSR